MIEKLSKRSIAKTLIVCSCLYATKTFLLLMIYHWQVPISQPKMIKCDPFKRRLLWSLNTFKSKSNLIGKDKVEYHQFLLCTDFINSDCLILIVEINEVLGCLEIILKSWIDWDGTDSPLLGNQEDGNILQLATAKLARVVDTILFGKPRSVKL